MSALVSLAYFSLFVLGLMDTIRGPFYPDILNELHLSGTRGSLFFAVPSLLAFFGAWASHRLVNGRSSVFLMIWAAVGLGLGYVAIAFSPDFAVLFFACILFGLPFGAMNLAQNMMVFEAAPKHLRRRLFNGLHSMYGAAALSAPLTASLFRWMGMSWRQAFLCLALFPAALTVWAWRQWRRSRGQTPPERVEPLNAGEWVRCLLLSGLVAAYMSAEISASSRMVLWLRRDLGFTPDMADLYLSGFFLALLSGRLLFSFVHFHRINNYFLLWASAGFGSLFYFLGLWLAPGWLIMAGVAMSPFFPVTMDQISVTFQNKSGQALGFALGTGSLAVVVMHVVIGWLADQIGLTRALNIGPLCLFVLLLSLSFPVFQLILSRKASRATP